MHSNTEHNLIRGTWMCNWAIFLPCAPGYSHQELALPSAQWHNAQVLLSNNSTLLPAPPAFHLEGLIRRISPELHSPIIFRLLNTPTVRNSSQTQPAGQTAWRNSKQTRPHTPLLWTSVSSKLIDTSNLQQKLRLQLPRCCSPTCEGIIDW